MLKIYPCFRIFDRSMTRIPFIYISHLLTLCLLSISAHPQVIINEILCSNGSTLISRETGQFADWIEIYNTDDNAIDLSGYFLSDSENNPAKWSFPPNSSIGPHAYLVIWADKVNGGLHTNFGLSKGGENW